MALKTFYGEVKKVVPDWLKIELVKLQSSVIKDLNLVKREIELLKDVALINYDSMREVIGNLNIILQACANNNDEKVVFGVNMPAEGIVFWKSFVQILCLKINMVDKTAKVTRRLTLHEFWRLRSELLKEIHYKNILENKKDCFELINNEGEVEGEEELMQQDLPIPCSLTVSTVLQRVDEMDGSGCNENECLICMDKKVEVSLPCAHSFCSKCIIQWHDSNQTCPVCRDQLNKPDEFWEFTDMPDLMEINDNVIKLASGT